MPACRRVARIHGCPCSPSGNARQRSAPSPTISLLWIDPRPPVDQPRAAGQPRSPPKGVRGCSRSALERRRWDVRPVALRVL